MASFLMLARIIALSMLATVPRDVVPRNLNNIIEIAAILNSSINLRKA